MTKIIDKVYIQSVSEFDQLKEKFPAFASAKVSERAKKNGAFEFDGDWYRGYSVLRTALSGSFYKVSFAGNIGYRDLYYMVSTNAGLRVALDMVYNPDSSIVGSCEEETRTTFLYNEDKRETENVTSTAPIVTTSKGIKYIWLNKEECENGDAKTMKLLMLDIEDCAVPLDKEGNHNDYGKVGKLRDQAHDVVRDGMSYEEWKMVVLVEMNSEDGYDKVTPILESEGEKE